MSASWIKGTGVALITPFKQDQSVDFKALEKLVQQVSLQGVNYLVALGTTAETPTLSNEEKKDIVQCILSANNKKLPVVLGAGGNDTKHVLDSMQAYPMDEIAAILSVVPYYNKPSQAGLLAHFKAIDQHTPKPIILYNVPGRTGVNMNASTSIQLAKECSQVIAIKEASGNMNQCMQLVQEAPEGFAVLSGDDDLVLAQIALGFQGVISVAANSFTKIFCAMVNHALNNQYDEARRLHYQLLEGIQLLFVEGNPAGVKAALHLQQRCENVLRLPVVPVSDGTYQSMKQFISTLA
jgi:4-hydroxy-tetrahydrodipicolinate synthase